MPIVAPNDTTTKAPDVDWTTLRADLVLPPPEGQRRPTAWRVARGDAEGFFDLPWLQIPSGPFDLTVYLDGNGNGRRDEREPVASLDSLFVTEDDSILTIEPDSLVLIDLEGPVEVRIELASVLVDSLDVVGWFEVDGAREARTAVADTNGVMTLEIPPGPVVWGAWLDVDGDRFFGPADSTGRSEAFVPRDTFQVFPARPETLRLAWPDSTLPFAVVDTLLPPVVSRDLVTDPPVPE